MGLSFRNVCLAAGAVLLAVADAAVIDKRGYFPYGSEKVRGVNLGGWFVLEPWINPSMWTQFNGDGSVVDEYTFCQRLGPDQCKSQLEQHWSTWYSQADFSDIAAAGLNHVRIPIGYWAVSPLPGDPYVQGQLDHLDQAIAWAGAAGLKVWVDLHGAPGSQNGFDNSGRRDELQWQAGAGNVAHTVAVVAALAKRYAAPQFSGTVAAIQLLNEPLGPALDLAGVRQFWQDGWGAVRDAGDTAVVIHDAFEPLTSWNGFMAQGWDNVVLDTHQYQVFTPAQLQLGLWQHIGAACDVGGQLTQTDKWTVVGEWSNARTDCATHLNGLGKGARLDNSLVGASAGWIGSCDGYTAGSVAAYSAQQREDSRRFVEAQLDAYEQGAGWMFWCWKTEGAPDWDMKDLLANGIFPQPLTARTYPGQCPGFSAS